MDMDLTRLDDHLDVLGVDGYLVHADSETADQYYLSGFDAPDAFTTLYDGEIHLLMSRSLEYARAKREARAATVERDIDYGASALEDEYGRYEAANRTIARFLDAYDVGAVATPPSFPLATADGLRSVGVDVAADQRGIVTDLRAQKTPREVEHIRTAQRANEQAMARAESVIADATIDDEGVLRTDGETLTSEAVQAEIEVTLVRNGCSLSDTIVACGRDAADPHERGAGPLRADEPIIVDIFPQHKASNYHADTTRTFARGDPGDVIRQWFDLTDRARQAALDVIEPGVTGAAVHDAVCDVYEDAGHPTLRSDDDTETGFIHSTGHGVGLEVHELPTVRPGAEELRPGNVVTIEPGLYDPAVGGVRIEDLVLVTGDGYENLTDYPVEFVLE